MAEALRQGRVRRPRRRPPLAGVASALTFEARRAGDQDVAPRQPVVVERLARLDGLAAASGPTSAGWASGGPGAPTTAWPGR